MSKFIKISTPRMYRELCKIPIGKYTVIAVRSIIFVDDLFSEVDEECKDDPELNLRAKIGVSLGGGYAEFLSDETAKQIEEKIDEKTLNM